MKKTSVLSFTIALLYMVLALVFYISTDFIENGTESIIVFMLLIPIHMVLIVGAGGASITGMVIFAILELLFLWLVLFIIIKLLKFVKGKFFNKSENIP